MLNLVTGTPGAGKSAYVVYQLDKVERKNKVNLQKNKVIFEKNKPLFDKFKEDFEYYEREVGSGHTLKKTIDILPIDYFDIFTQDYDDLRPDDYFLRSTQYNEICERINEREGVQGFEGLKPVRTIYTNINALKIDYVRSLEYDWRDCPDGSIVVIDEVQLVEPYSDLKNKNNEIIQQLTIHRHRGFDFYFITQYPSLLHPTVKDLIGLHLHCTKPYGMGTKIYQWGSCRPYPNTQSNKQNCETKFSFKHPASLFKLYKSTTINTAKKRIPWKMVFVFSGLILFCLSMFVYGLSGTKQSQLLNPENAQQDESQSVTDSIAQIQSNPMLSSSHSPPSLPAHPDPQQAHLQKVDDLRNKYLPNHIVEMTQSDEVTPTSVVAMGDKCMAYNKYSERLIIDDATCHSLLVAGNMPKSRTVSTTLDDGNIAIN